MTIHFKITRQLLEQTREDLSRPHPFAFERVGFLFMRQGAATLLCNPLQSNSRNASQDTPPMKSPHKWYSRLLRWLSPTQSGIYEMPVKGGGIDESGTQRGDTLMMLASAYVPVYDEDYIDDPTVGAKIGSSAIRNAMQRSMDTGMGVIHIHMHEGIGRPGFSSTDRKSMNNLMPSFFNVSPGVPHGAVVINRDSMAGVVWKNKETPLVISRVSVIGYPCKFSGGIDHVRALQ